MKCAPQVDLCMTRGDDKDFDLTFTLEGTTPLDLTGSSIRFTVKSGGTVLISKEVTAHDVPLEGRTTITVTHNDSDIEAGRYPYDIQLTSSSGKVTTVLKGLFAITHEVTGAV